MMRAWGVLLLVVGCGDDGPALPADADPNAPDASFAQCSDPPVGGEPALALELITDQLEFPVWLGSPPADRRLFVIEKDAGRVRIIDESGALRPTPFLDIDDRILSTFDERGLLGLAFHPDYGQNRRFFVYFTDLSANIQVSEYRASAADPDLADESTLVDIINIPHQGAYNHNGGSMAFGPDGYLYFGTGDGGGGDDPDGNGQDTSQLLGKIVRIDVDGAAPYAIPATNPFLGAGARGEIWAYGVRNPWRFAFDRGTGDLYIGDVGQGTYEEVDYQPASSAGGENYGWDVVEGTGCHEPTTGCDMGNKVAPVYQHDRNEGTCVTGGYVYRGCRMPGHHGKYIFGDYGSGLVRSFQVIAGAATDQQDHDGLRRSSDVITSFGEDAEGELYLLDGNGRVFKIVPAP